MTIEVHLDDKTLEQVRALARRRNSTIEALIEDVIVQLADAAKTDTTKNEDRILGMFADEPELLDEVVQSAMQARERDPLRYGHG